MIDELIQELRSYPAHYTAAHRAAVALEKDVSNARAREYHNIYLEDQLIKAEQEIERLREHIAQQQLDIVTLGQEVGRLREALERTPKIAEDFGAAFVAPHQSDYAQGYNAACYVISMTLRDLARAALGEEKK